jgi:hypothetical protein
MINKPIFITGCARSGTSMTAGVINICGAWGGNMARANRNNKKGMFENRTVVNEMTKPLLTEIGADPMGQNPLPNIRDFEEQNSLVWGKRFEDIMRSQGYEDEYRLMYKGAKMCLMWTLWDRAFPNAKWIIVRRRSDDIINSCMRTGFMSRYKDKEGWLFWVREHVKRFREMYESRLQIMEVFPQEMIDGHYTEMESVIEWLGLDWKEKEVKEFISPDLWNREKE